MSEHKKMMLEALLAEYKEMRTESLQKFQIQITLISLYFTVFGTILVFAIERNIIEDTVIISPYFMCLLIPMIMMVIAVIWLDQAHRQTRIAAYISFIERKVNVMLELKNTIASSALFAEQWLRGNITTNKIINVNRLFYYICLGIFLLFPPLSCAAGMYLSNWIWNYYVIPLSFAAFGYIVYLFFVVSYVRSILAFNKLITDGDTSKNLSQLNKQT